MKPFGVMLFRLELGYTNKIVDAREKTWKGKVSTKQTGLEVYNYWHLHSGD